MMMIGKNESELTMLELEQDELKGFARSLAEIDWLLLVLVLLYIVVPGSLVTNRDVVVIAMVAFAAFVVIFHYANFYTRYTRWKLAIETWAMLIFITVVMWNTGGANSILLNLYLLVIIACALTLGKVMTLLEVGLIASCFSYLSFLNMQGQIFSMVYVSQVLAQLTPFLLVAYLTTMLANDSHQARMRIKELAETDELTGLPNMRAFTKILEREHEKCLRYGRQYGLLMVDADNLKHINDKFGHEQGNRLLKEVAAALTASIRSTDLAARYGGDEFIILLVETNHDEVRDVVARVHRTIRSLGFYGQDASGTGPTVSIGIAMYPADGTEIKQLVVAADRAMYAAKAKRVDI